MRVAVDATALLDPPTGIGVFTRRLLEGLGRRPDVAPIAYAASWRGRDRLRAEVPATVEVRDRPLPARLSRRWWQRVDRPAIERWTGPFDVVHGPNFVVPPSSQGAEVVTVHDLTTVHHPELCHRSTLVFPELVQRAVNRGALVHTVSDFVAGEVRDHFDVDPDAVITVHNGIDLPADDDAPREPAGINAPFILALGTVEPRKGLPGLVAAFDHVAEAEPDIRLVIAGPDGWGAEPLTAALERSRHRDRIDRIGWVSDSRRRALLGEARLLAYPSIYEGFGLPPLEAMAAGTPVVATDAGALPEVLGDAAVLVEVGEVAGLADSIVTLLRDESHAADLVARGRRRVLAFDWTSCVAGVVHIYETAIERRAT